MHITYLTLEAPREGQASFTHVHEIIGGLRAHGHDIHLYQPSYTDRPASPGLLTRLIFSIALQAKLWVGWQRHSLLYVRGHYLAFPSALIARIFHIPVVHEINGPYEDPFITYPALNHVRRLLIWTQRLQYRWASALIAVTEELRQWAFLESRGRPCIHIPNGVNTDLFKPDLPRPSGLPDKYVIFFGGLAAWHGIHTMIDALNNPAWPADTDLVVIGDGPGTAALQDAARHNKHLHLLGRMPYRDVPAHAAHAVAGLIPISNPSGRADTGLFPLKLFETLACGVPVIATDFPGQADLVRQYDCGLIIPPGDAPALAAAVAKLSADTDLAAVMGLRGHRAMSTDHSWRNRAEATHRTLISLIRN